ncbi:aminotransferase class I/II-fold pyridoxal phosphate-dependent enzyme [Spirochaetia bacterium 38H-sp]|uniref:Aminotransferase class I/II-fold pyridoxal phosphate-dependent enzyme n=1 Tax=Rarispira pelagica TaxID=3141764 RepID=A0ABU9UC04_9SPIR
MSWFETFFAEQEYQLKERNQYRQIQAILRKGKHIITGKNQVLNLASNDYLGLAGNSQHIEDFLKQYKNNIFMGSTSSRLISGDSPELREAEERFAKWIKKETALILPSGYHANISIFAAFQETDTCVFMDKSCHASMYDGVKLGSLKLYRYPHNNMEMLLKLLKKHRAKHKNAIIATEALFSMDGDTADIKNISQLAKEYDCISIVDEAHSIGITGPHGAGITRKTELEQDIDIIIATGGKALGAAGGLIACSNKIRTFLINRSRPLIYSTAISPIIAAWLSYTMEKVKKMQKEREKLKSLWEYTRKKLKQKGYNTGNSNMQIIPIITGSSKQALFLSEKLRNNGIYSPAIRPPTVRETKSCVRISITSLMEKTDIHQLLESIGDTQYES